MIDTAKIALLLPCYVHGCLLDELTVKVKPCHRLGLDDVCFFREDVLVSELREELLEVRLGRVFVCAGFVFVSARRISDCCDRRRGEEWMPYVSTMMYSG